MVCLLLVDLFTYPGCLWSGSSGSPSGSDSPGYLSPDHPHPRSATLLSPRIISQILYRDSSTQARILVTAPIVVYIIGEVVFHISFFIVHVLTALNSSQLAVIHVLTGGSDQSDSRL